MWTALPSFKDVDIDSAVELHHVSEHPNLVPKFAMCKLHKGEGHVFRKCCEAVVIHSRDPELNRKIEGRGAMELYF